MSEKLKLLCIFPGPTYRPDMIDFRNRFELLSEYCEGEVYSWSCRDEHKEITMGSFQYRGLINKDKTKVKAQMRKHILDCANAYYEKHGRVDVIICYEPLFTGVIGAKLKKKFGCKLIVELNNSNLREAMTMEGVAGLKTKPALQPPSLINCRLRSM